MLGLGNNFSRGGVLSGFEFTENYSLILDGTDDYAETGSNVGISGDASRTLSFWVSFDVTGRTEHIINWGATGSNEAFGFYKYVNKDIYFYDDGSDLNTTFEGDEVDTWYHIVATYDGTTVRTYQNAVAKATKTVTLDTTDSHLFIGTKMDGSNDFIGKLDEIAIWNAVLTADDITSIYNSGVPNNLLDAASYDSDKSDNLVGWWGFEEGSGASALDNSTNSNTATLNNDATYSATVPS
tara:strand:- start:138 stop:854 length:717 start_codon:yes stop_codon:yes gene_type:complete